MSIRIFLIAAALAGCSFGDNGTFQQPTGACGDARVDPSEGCDDGNTVGGDGCSEDCAVETPNPVCGNDVREAGEPCDDGNSTDGDGCSSTCQVESVCGNAIRETGEACDDGNTANGDGCSSACQVEDATACVIVPQSGCPAGDACDFANDNGDTECRDVSANGTADSRCAVDTACAVGFTCVGDPDAPNVAWCDRFCTSDSQCGADARCVIDLVDANGDPLPVRVCSNACDIASQTGCPQGLGCLGRESSTGDFTTCQIMGTKLDGQTCASSTDCLPGSLCVTVGGLATCHEYCDVDDPAACGLGETCTNFTTPLVIAGTTFGACAK
jgi:large repetitive protein